jgi:hypothetical protein
MATCAILKFVPELEKEDIITPVTHFLLQVFGATVNTAKTLEAAYALELCYLFLGNTLHSTGDGRRDAQIGF